MAVTSVLTRSLVMATACVAFVMLPSRAEAQAAAPRRPPSPRARGSRRVAGSLPKRAIVRIAPPLRFT